MRVSLAQISAVARRVSVLAFALWLGGAGCLFCCQADVAPAADTSTPPARFTAHGTHSCCTARAATRAAADSRGSAVNAFAPRLARGPARHACPHDTLVLAHAARRPRALEPTVATFAKATTRVLRVAAFTPAPCARSRLPDGGETYLRLAVLLI